MLKLFIHRKWIKTAASLTSVMGLTWITGVLVFHEALIPVAYIFTIFVAFEVTKVACTHIVTHGCNIIMVFYIAIVAHVWSYGLQLFLRYHCCISLTSVGCCHICLVCGGLQAGMAFTEHV